jgi:hypothetical protein
VNGLFALSQGIVNGKEFVDVDWVNGFIMALYRKDAIGHIIVLKL